MIEEILVDCEERMRKSDEATQRELAALRTGHAHVGLVDHILVDYFGAMTPVKQMATVSAPEARLLTIQPWDRNGLAAIEKALMSSDLGLTPSNDGMLIRLSIPPLTEQRRKELIKVVNKRVEDGRIAVRNVRRDGLEQSKRLVQSKEISEDDRHRAQDQLQKLTDRYVSAIDQRGRAKETELMEI